MIIYRRFSWGYVFFLPRLYYQKKKNSNFPQWILKIKFLVFSTFSVGENCFWLQFVYLAAQSLVFLYIRFLTLINIHWLPRIDIYFSKCTIVCSLLEFVCVIRILHHVQLVRQILVYGKLFSEFWWFYNAFNITKLLCIIDVKCNNFFLIMCNWFLPNINRNTQNNSVAILFMVLGNRYSMWLYNCCSLMVWLN